MADRVVLIASMLVCMVFLAKAVTEHDKTARIKTHEGKMNVLCAERMESLPEAIWLHFARIAWCAFLASAFYMVGSRDCAINMQAENRRMEVRVRETNAENDRLATIVAKYEEAKCSTETLAKQVAQLTEERDALNVQVAQAAEHGVFVKKA